MSNDYVNGSEARGALTIKLESFTCRSKPFSNSCCNSSGHRWSIVLRTGIDDNNKYENFLPMHGNRTAEFKKEIIFFFSKQTQVFMTFKQSQTTNGIKAEKACYIKMFGLIGYFIRHKSNTA